MGWGLAGKKSSVRWAAVQSVYLCVTPMGATRNVKGQRMPKRNPQDAP